MITAKELKTWLDTLPKDAPLWIPLGHQSLLVIDSEAHLEIGGTSNRYKMTRPDTPQLKNA